MIRNNTFPNRDTGITRFSVLFMLSLLSFLTLISCDDEASIIGEELQPPSEKLDVIYIDTLSLDAFSLTQDSIISSGFETALVGTIQDIVFGSSTASFLTRIRLSGTDNNPTPFIPGEGTVTDSLILTVLPEGFYGDVNTEMIVKVYRLDEDILRDSIYYSNHKPEYELNSEQTFRIAVNDTLLQLKLDTSFFGTPLSEIDTIETNAELRGFFKGIYFAFDSIVAGEGAIFLLDVLSPSSKLTLYYHDINNDTIPEEYTFNINIFSARANLFFHDYSTGSIAHLNDTLVEDTLIYIQGLGGTYAKIDFPFLEELRNLGPMVVNKAEIKFKLWEYYDNTLFTRPEELRLLRKNEEGKFTPLFDEALGEDYFGGRLDEESGTYTFNITAHLKTLLNDETGDTSIYLFMRNPIDSPERVALFNNTSPNNIGFRFVYTKL
ncbi:MAG: DUF4270 domain-containing protein [Bacteroidales bacterium]|nr:MAG: DUF4270 domain-containing protein [Bacteroidales bacterium]